MTDKGNRGAGSAKPVECAHDWQEEYYGFRCAKCDQFHPFGLEPWAYFNESEDEFSMRDCDD